MREDITDAWLLTVGFVRTGERWCFDLNETTSLLLQRTPDALAWLAYVEVDGVAVKLPRRLVSRGNIVTLIPALGGKLHHLVEV